MAKSGLRILSDKVLSLVAAFSLEVNMSSGFLCLFLFFLSFFGLFVLFSVWLCQVLVAACGVFSWGLWDLVP